MGKLHDLKRLGDTRGVDWKPLLDKHGMTFETLDSMLEGAVPPDRSVLLSMLNTVMPVVGAHAIQDEPLRRIFLSEILKLPDLSAQEKPTTRIYRQRPVVTQPKEQAFTLTLREVMGTHGIRYEDVIASAKSAYKTDPDTRRRPQSYLYLPINVLLDVMQPMGITAEDCRQLLKAYDETHALEQRKSSARHDPSSLPRARAEKKYGEPRTPQRGR